jgi:hypothetical protein
MTQGDNKTGQKRTNAMFVMTHDKIAHAYREKNLCQPDCRLPTPKR